MIFKSPVRRSGEQTRTGCDPTRRRVRDFVRRGLREGIHFSGPPGVFREGAENCARGGRAPQGHLDFQIKRPTRSFAAFSLLEVMIAIAIFFTAAFAILTLVAGGLRNARMLQRPQVDAGAIASVFSTTNSIIEGSDNGDLGDVLGDTYKGYTWESSSREVESNKLFEVDFTVHSPAPGHPVFSQISTRFFRPQSPAGSLDGGMGIH